MASASPRVAKPSQFSLDKAIRSNILALLPYRCARDDYSEGILLDANENALGHALPKVDRPLDNGHADGHTGAPVDSESSVPTRSIEQQQHRDRD